MSEFAKHGSIYVRQLTRLAVHVEKTRAVTYISFTGV